MEAYERRDALGQGRAPAIVSTYSIIAVAVALTAVLFAAVVRLGDSTPGPPQVATLQQGSGLQVVRSDPVPLPRVLATLSAPGRVALNGDPSNGFAAGAQGAPLAAEGTLSGGDTLRVCTDLPAPVVELALLDAATGAVLSRHTFLAPPLCGR